MNQLIQKTIAFSLATLIANSLLATDYEYINPDGFTENCGQVRNQFGEENTAVKYIWSAGKNLNVQLKSDGLSYDFFEKTANEKVKFHRLDMRIIGGEGNAPITALQYAAGESNYINSHAGQQIMHVNTARNLRVNGIYSAVDWDIKVTDEGNLKYDFIAKNLGAMEKIKLAYSGFDHFELCDGALHFTIGGRTIVERIPESWIDETGESMAINYRIESSETNSLIVRFEQAESCAWDGTLVIDPQAEFAWGTYYGSPAMDLAQAVSVDSLGNVFVVGTTQSLQTIASEGSNQGEFAGGTTDAYLVKFNQHGLRHWATYIGGDGDDAALAINVDHYETLYVVGTTTSSNILQSDSTYQPAAGGGTDGFVASFNRDGYLLWDTYLGGAGEDIANSCVADNLGHVFVGGHTDAPGFLGNDSISPLLPAQGGVDGFIAQLNASGALTWCTYFGGSGDDQVTGVAVDSLYSVYATGYTNSSSGIASGMAFQSALAGETDGFILKLDSALTFQWATYIGSSGDDKLNGVVASSSKVIVVGTTNGDLLLADTNSFQPTLGGGYDAFITMMHSDGLFDRFTYLGGAADDNGMAVCRDYAGDVYITGTTRSDSVMASENQMRDTLLGGQDAYIAKFSSDGSLVWSTYHGGEGLETGLGIAVLGYTAVYPVGMTNSLENISLDGYFEMSHQPEYAEGNTDGYIGRFTQVLSTACPGICPWACGGGAGGSGGGGGGGGGGGSGPPPPIGLCIGDSMQLSVGGGALGIGAEWVWYADSCGGTDNFIGDGNSVWVAPVVTTSYYVRAESVDCITRCSGVTVHVDYPPTVTASALDSICPGTTLLLFAEGAYSYAWTGPDGYESDQEFPVIDSVSSAAAGLYEVIGSTQFGCRDTAQVDVFLYNSPQFALASTPASCHGLSDGSISLASADSTVVAIQWLQFPLLDSALVVDSLPAGLYSAIATNTIGCQSLDTISVTEPKALIDSLYAQPAYCDRPNGSTQVFASGGLAPYSTSWSGNLELDDLFLSAMYAGTYTIFVSDSLGCTDSTTVTIPNLGFFTTVIEPDTITLEYLAIGSIDYYTVPEVNIASYYWTPPEAVSCQLCPDPDIIPANSMDLTLLLVSDRGCTSADSLHIIRLLPDPSAFVPNRFSPNGDGLNDELCVMGWRMEQFKLQVFDRTGAMVFQSTTDAEQCWDGNLNGKPINGPLIYTFEAVLEENVNIQENGQIFILR